MKYPRLPVLHITQEALVIAHKHHGLNLLDGLEHNTDDDDQAGTAERHVGVEHAAEEERQDAHDRQTGCTDENDIVENPVQIFARRLTGTDARDKAA